MFDAEKAFKELGDKVLASHEETRHEVVRINRSLRRLWRRVTGSDPPPDPGDDGLNGQGSDSEPPIDEQASAGYSASKEMEEVRAELAWVKTELCKQSSSMALDKKGWHKLFTVEGLKVVGTVVAALASLVTVLYSIWRGLPPTPLP